jgi:site-specific DNA recombinase
MATAKPYEEPSIYPIQKEDKNKVVYATIYSRVSSPNQVKEYSLEEQERRCQERCDLMGWRVRYIFREEGASGATLNRPKFQTMLEKARMERFDILVFWKLDRFCRSLVDLVNIERELRGYGISLHSVTEQIDTTTPVGKFNFRNLASAAELERDLIKERAKMGMHALARQHKWPNKNPPLGYDKVGDGRLKINGQEAERVRTIFIMYRDSKSMPEVAYRLNEKGIRTKRGNEWSVPSIKKVLDDELYIGRYKVAGVDDQVEEYRIIEDELFREAREIRQKFKPKPPMPEDRKEATIDRIFDEYIKYLHESGKEERESQSEFRVV